ncbi:hypothetical protein [Enterococcus sp. 5H]|uniref:hypothetical protein n=1 Tax=Enterococcus sp. 5H TaxID=1229490 RepID=UPI002304BF25|nr:hypothetical protein [Enterococcus sp. 5H]MDA9472063.1 hypothetical protein [Enterococcus sp. 5H]
MHEWSLVGLTAVQASEQVSRMLCKGSVDLSAWEELSKQPDLKPKPNKRNGTMDRRQAFGGLFNRGGVKD